MDLGEVTLWVDVQGPDEGERGELMQYVLG